VSEILDAALMYARAGIRVFPVRGKHPIVSSWKEDASSNEDVVRILFDSKQEGTGVAGIIPEWAVVLDIDGEDGRKAIADHNLEIPDTLTAHTKKGEHRWYKVDNEILSRKIGVLPKVDILVKGYVVMPPSPPEYKWSDGFDINKMVDAPAWLKTITRQDDSKRAGVDPDRFFDGVPEGERQTSIFRYACYLRAMPRMTLGQAKHLVVAVAKTCDFKDEDPIAILERVWNTYDGAEAKEKEEEHSVHSLADLSAQNLPRAKHLVKDLLPAVGYSLLSAPPKVGKSLIGAHVAISVASGIPFWGREVDQCGVLYLDLEQDDSEAMARWETIRDSVGLKSFPVGLYTAFTWNRSDNGGLEKIAEFLRDHPYVRLIVVDTLFDLWPEKEIGGNAYKNDQFVVAPIVRLAHKMECAILVVHHDRKGSPGDKIITKAGGSYAITGKAKAYWSLDGDEDSDEGCLRTSGKNIPRDTIHIKLDRKALIWHVADHA